MQAARSAVTSVGIWIRVSTDDQARSDSPEHHERRARAYAEAKGWPVVEVYRLEGVSGKAVAAHPETKRMLADVRSGRINALVFSKLARLARSTKELLEFAEVFRDCGADLVSLQESIDTSSPAGRLFFTMIAAMAQWEREEIASRVSASVAVRAKMGKRLGGGGPFGYHWDGGKLVPHPTEAPIRVLVHELFLEHRRMKTVARVLNERGYRTRAGCLFSNTTIFRLIHDTTAKGIYRSNYSMTTDRSHSWALKPEEDWVLTPVTPLVSEEVWDACVAIVADQRSRRRPPSKKTPHLFTGILHCDCGTKMYVWGHSPTYWCKGCRRKIPTGDIEAVYRDQLRGFLLSPERVAEHMADANALLQEKEALVTAVDEEMKKVRAEDDRLYELYVSREISAEDYGRRYRPLTERRNQLEEELPSLQAQCDVLRVNIASEAENVVSARSLYDQWDNLNVEEKRSLVEAITDKVIVGAEEIDIQLMNLPTAGTSVGTGMGPVRCGSHSSRLSGAVSQVGEASTPRV